MAQNPGSIASDPVDHLTGDPLILWAVGDGVIHRTLADGTIQGSRGEVVFG